MKKVFCFRNDLRIEQHPLLHEFLHVQNERELVFVATPSHLRARHHRRKWIEAHLEDLRIRLDRLGLSLSIHWNPQFFCDAQDDAEVWCVDEVGTEEERQLLEWEKNPRILIRRGMPNQLIPFSKIEKTAIPEVFTSFRKRYQEHIEAAVQSEADLRWIRPDDLDGNLVVERFQVGEVFAIGMVQDFIWKSKRLLTYADTRNGMLEFLHSSKFSPYLALGVLSVRWIYRQVLEFERQHGSGPSIDHFKMELLWREYFRFIHHKKGHQWYLAQQKETSSRQNTIEVFEKWKRGETGEVFIDANMRELEATGFMSNRGRQNVASYLSKILGLDYRWGARYFEEQLIDYDVCNNWGNWSYLAGVGQDPRNRVFHPKLQAERYDPEGRYVQKWLQSD